MGGYERQADYGIITALRDELAALRAALTGVEEVQLGTSDIRYYYRGRLSCRDGSEVTVVCACSSEMGQQPALNVTRDLIAAWKPRHVFLVGIAGGFPGRGTSYGDVVVPLRVHYYEPGKLIPNSVGPDGAQRGRIPRWRTFTTSARLSSAVEALAVEDADWLRRVSVPRPDGGEQKPQILRDELASGEEVWASLESPITQEVLSRSDKILAVENEASGFLSAVLESPHPPDALVIKALSDLVAGKDDRWRAFAASASAAFAVAVIEKLGARWRSEGSTSGQADKSSGEGEEWTIPSDLQRLLDEADTLVAQSRYRDAREKLRLVLQAAKPGSPAARVYGIVCILGVLILLTLSFSLWPTAPSIIVPGNGTPLGIGIKTVDKSGNVLNATNTKLLEYVLYKEDKHRQWQYLQTTKSSDEEHTVLGVYEHGIYNIEVYDLGVFLGVATDIIVKKDDIRVTINTSEKRIVKVKVELEDSIIAVSNVMIQIFNERIKDQYMLRNVTNDRGEVEFLVWPTLVPQESYVIRVIDEGREVHRSQPFQISNSEEPEVILVKLRPDRKGSELK